MTTFDVDLDELRAVTGRIGTCQRALLDLASDVEVEHGALHRSWSGLARDADATSYARWRESCADMVTALAALRALGRTAEDNYRAAAEHNATLWQRAR